MSKQQAIFNLVLSLIGIAGIFFFNYWGGVISGVCLTLIFLTTLGRSQAKKAADHIDQVIRSNQKQKEEE